MAASHVLAGKKDQFLHVRGYFPAVQNLDLKLNVTDAGLDWGRPLQNDQHFFHYLIGARYK